MNRTLYCIANNIPTHFANELILHSKVTPVTSQSPSSPFKVQSYLLLKDKVDCYPESYVLPDEEALFQQHKHEHKLWILKEDMIDRGTLGWLTGHLSAFC